MRREPQNSSIPVPHAVQSGGGILNHTGGTYSHGGLITRDFQFRNCIWESYKTMELQSWKVNFKTEVCSKSADPRITIRWIKEDETAKSIDDLMTSHSITGRRYFLDCNMLDAMIASALKKLLNTHVHFRKRVCVEEQRDSKIRPILTRRQIACMIYEDFRATGAYEAIQGLSDLFKKRLQNDEVQDFGRSMGPTSIVQQAKCPQM